jgi:hypothetical protein
VLTLAVLETGCSSQPSAVSAAQQNVQKWEAALRVDAEALRVQCHLAEAAGKGCAEMGMLTAQYNWDMAHVDQAQVALDRAEGHPVSTTTSCPAGPDSCGVFKEPSTTTTTCPHSPGMVTVHCPGTTGGGSVSPNNP